MNTIKSKMKYISILYLNGKLSAREYRVQFDSLWIELTNYLKGGDKYDTSTKSI